VDDARLNLAQVRHAKRAPRRGDDDIPNLDPLERFAPLVLEIYTAGIGPPARPSPAVVKLSADPTVGTKAMQQGLAPFFQGVG
jgi:hypothetical protein